MNILVGVWLSSSLDVSSESTTLSTNGDVSRSAVLCEWDYPDLGVVSVS